MTAALALAIDDNAVSPGVLGFLVVAALGVATWLLIRSMNRQMRKIDFDEDAIERERSKSDPDLLPQPEDSTDEVAQPVKTEPPVVERRDGDDG